METAFDSSGPSDFDSAKVFFDAQLPGLTERLCLCANKRARFAELFLAALAESSQTICRCRTAGMVPPTATGRALLDYLEEVAVGDDSELVGAEHVATALNFMRKGGNVLMVQNHRSGADTVVWDRLINQHFDGAAREFGYMAGHVVAFYLLPFTLVSGIRRFQIFSAKYKTQADEVGLPEEAMREQNSRALRALAGWVRCGGNGVGLYPEGGRSEGGLLEGNYRTSKIGGVIASQSPKGLMLLPTYVDGTTSILPVVRSHDEFQRFICYIRRGTATVTCGEPILWDDLCPQSTSALDKDERQRHIHRLTMQAIASLAPAETRGFWS